MTGPPDLAADPKHIALAFAIAASFARRFPPLTDEYESECLVALCEAANSFDPGRGVRFSTHAANRIRGAMLDIQRQWTPCGFRRRADAAPDVGSIDAPTATGEDGRPLALAEILASGDGPVGWEAEYQDELRGYARRTAKGSGEALVRFYGHADTATMERVGESLGLSESRVSQRLAAGVADLADRFGRMTPGEMIMVGTARSTREELLRDVSMGGHEDGGAGDPAPGGEGDDATPPAPTPPRACPDCGRPYGVRARCYACKPGAPPPPRRKRPARPDAIPPTTPAAIVRASAPAPPASAMKREVLAAAAVADALDGLDADSATRVLAWVAAHFVDGGAR